MLQERASQTFSVWRWPRSGWSPLQYEREGDTHQTGQPSFMGPHHSLSLSIDQGSITRGSDPASDPLLDYSLQ